MVRQNETSPAVATISKTDEENKQQELQPKPETNNKNKHQLHQQQHPFHHQEGQKILQERREQTSKSTSSVRRNNKNNNIPVVVERSTLGRKLSSDSSSSSLSSLKKNQEGSKQDLVICHGSARSIVFRDHLRLAAKIIREETDQQLLLSDDDEISNQDADNNSDSDDDDEDPVLGDLRHSIQQSIRDSINNAEDNKMIAQEIHNLAHEMVPELDDSKLDATGDQTNVEIEGQQVHVKPLPQLELGPEQDFEPLSQENYVSTTTSSTTDWTTAEREVYTMLKNQQACVKTIKNPEWPSFLERFQRPLCRQHHHRYPTQHEDIPPCKGEEEEGFPFNSFVTSTSLLPEEGKKMRCYGSLHAYPVGVVFALPTFSSPEQEEDVAQRTKTWSWPAGYAAKTEFNIDDHGRLINGREEALVSLRTIRAYNHDYVHSTDHVIGGRLIKGGFKVIPYNEVFLRVGGPGRIVGNNGTTTISSSNGRSLERGVGLPVALFIRSITMGDIMALFRTKARMAHVLGEQHIRDMPLLVIDPNTGVKVISKSLQNPHLAPMLKNKIDVDDPKLKIYLEQKAQEQLLFDEDDDGNDLPTYLNLEECAKLAGGFGSTDEFIGKVLERAQKESEERLQRVTRTGLKSALRSNDYYTARQMLVMYHIVASGHFGDGWWFQQQQDTKPTTTITKGDGTSDKIPVLDFSYYFKKETLPDSKSPEMVPSLDTWRLRNATNSRGLLVVLGAAKILKSIQDGGAQQRTRESIAAVQEWVEYGERSMAFRIASWSKQRALESDTKVALDGNASQFMAFVSNKAIMNRKTFAQKLQQSLQQKQDCNTDDSTTRHYSKGIFDIIENLHSP
eukprot:scaffold14198_cov107-Cylindrotheca_fusiformis.AAC.2